MLGGLGYTCQLFFLSLDRDAQTDVCCSPIHPMTSVMITTDGSCYPNDGTGNGGWAAVIRVEGESAREISGGLRRNAINPVSNNKAEFAAVLEGLRAIADRAPCKVLIRTDSEYVMKSLTIWHEGWAARGWLTATKEPVKNRDLIETILAEMSKHVVEWIWIRGHCGDTDNERCDILAMAARQALNRV